MDDRESSRLRRKLSHVIRFKDFGTLRLIDSTSIIIPQQTIYNGQIISKSKGQGQSPSPGKRRKLPEVTLEMDTDSRPKNRMQPQKKSDQLVNLNVKKINPKKSNYEIRNLSQYLSLYLQAVGSAIQTMRRKRMRTRKMI